MQSDALVELLAREHRTVEGLLDELAALDANEASDHADLFGVIQIYATMSKAALVQALCDRR
jgi:hypothetical protein